MVILIVVAVSAGACSDRRDQQELAVGGSIEVLAVWSDAEQERFEQVLRAFEERSSVDVTYTSVGHNVAQALGERIAAGNRPDVAVLPQPGLLRRFAAEGVLVPLEQRAADVVEANYPDVWRKLGTVDGVLYGVWFKAANKSLVWYNITAFERAGIVPPDDFPGLLAAADAIAATGISPFAVAGADGWTLTDLFENVYLGSAGSRSYDLLTAHEIPWTHPSVKLALGLMAQLLDPTRIPGGPGAALTVKFDAAVQQVFAQDAQAAMVIEGDFVAGVVTGSTTSELGIDADAFPFPTVDGGSPAIVGGGDAAVLLRDTPAGHALLRFLATPEAASIWAASGGFISPNENVDLAVYPDDITRSVARGLLQAGDAFRFDLSDMQPSAFGGLADRGMRKALQDFLVTRDVETISARLESEAAAAFQT